MSDAVASGCLGRGDGTNRDFPVCAGTFVGNMEDTKGRDTPEPVRGSLSIVLRRLAETFEHRNRDGSA